MKMYKYTAHGNESSHAMPVRDPGDVQIEMEHL